MFVGQELLQAVIMLAGATKRLARESCKSGGGLWSSLAAVSPLSRHLSSEAAVEKRIATLFPGDGIGPEISASVKQVDNNNRRCA